nr:zinc finger, CCHC-type [Tanacetum cinerariifolium]
MNGNETIRFDKSNVECYNCHKRRHFARECIAQRSKDTKHNESTRRNVLVETPTSASLVSCDGLGSHYWSDQAEDGPTNFALMAYSSTSSNSKVSAKSNCSSSCLENVKILKKENEQLLIELRTSMIHSITYKTGIESVEARLLVYKKKESVYKEGIKLLKFKKPAAKTSEAKASTYKPKEVRKNFSPPFIEDWISDCKDEAELKPKIKKKIVKPSFSKIEFIKSKEKVKSPRKITVKQEDPRTYDEAMQSQDSVFWKEAIDDEICSIMENNTWVLSNLPPGCKPLGCKWIFKRKMKVDGTIDMFKARLEVFSSRFSMKDMGEVDVILGIKIKSEKKWIVIIQSHYIKKIPKKLNCEDYSPVSTLIDLINHVENSSSTSGWVFLLGGGTISWASKKQTCITSSTIESEFVALAATGKEAKWLRNLIHEIPIWPKPIASISIQCDSAPTMARAYSYIYNGNSRHLRVRYSMIMTLIMKG